MKGLQNSKTDYPLRIFPFYRYKPAAYNASLGYLLVVDRIL